MLRGAMLVGRSSICTENCDDLKWFVIGLQFGKSACYQLTAPDRPISTIRADKAKPLTRCRVFSEFFIIRQQGVLKSVIK